MAKPRKLPAPPITEAVLDVRVTFTEPPSIDSLAAIAPELCGYSEANRIRQTGFQFAIAEVRPNRAPPELGGANLHLKDRTSPNWFSIPKLQALGSLDSIKTGLHHTLAAML